MSKEVDQRIVEMRFDNSHFENNVKTSMSTLEKLKQSLSNFGSSGKNIDSAAKGVNLSGLSTAVEGVKEKFSALEIVGVTALVNIANSAINAGKQLVESLAIEPITQGFEEYELKMGSVQTIMNSSGQTLDVVNGYLERLNEYADKTIYFFSDMTSSIGKFTNAGVDLDTAVKAIQGISNEAAVSGANAEQASHAMYNFAQALSSGSVKLIDWKSIENANMATVEFKEELIKTALELGTLRQEGDKYISTTTDMQGKVSDAFDATSRFNDSLSAQWMTSEVLTTTLAKYADETTELGQKAFESATKVRTFTQLMDTLKEAVGSGWAQTFEILIGDFNEATELWTAVSDTVGGFVDGMSQARNDLLKGWKDLGGRTDIVDALKNTFEGLKSVIVPVKEAFQEIFPPLTAERLKEISEGIKNLTANFKMGETTADNLKRTFKGLFAIVDMGKQFFSAILGGLSSMLGMLPGVSGGILDVTSSIGDWLVALDECLKGNQSFKKIIEGVVDFIKSIPGKINLDWFKNIFESLKNPDLSGFDNIIEAVKSRSELLGGALEKAKTIITKIVGFFSNAFNGLSADPLTGFVDGVKDVFNSIISYLEQISPTLSNVATSAGNALGSLFNAIAKVLDGVNLQTIGSLLRDGTLLYSVINMSKFLHSMSEMMESAQGALDGLKNSLNAKALLEIAKALGILVGAIVALSFLDGDEILKGLGTITLVLGELLVVMFATTKLVKGVEAAKMASLAGTIISISASILILSIAIRGMVKVVDALIPSIKELGSLNPEQFEQGLKGLGAIVLGLTAFLKLVDLGKTSIVKAAGVVIIAEGIKMLVSCVSMLATLNFGDFLQGIIGLGVSIGALAVVMKALPTDIKAIGTLILLTGAIVILTACLKDLSSLSWGEIGKALGSLAGGLVVIGGLSYILAAAAPAIIAVGGALIIFGGGLLILVEAIKAIVEIWDMFTKSSDDATSRIKALPETINKAVSGFPGKITEMFSGLPSKLKGLLGDLPGKIVELFGNIPGKIGEFFNDLPGKIGEKLSGAVGAVKEKFEDFKNSGSELVDRFKSGLGEKIGDLKTRGSEAVANFKAGIGERFEDLKTRGGEFVSNFIAGAKDKLPDLRISVLDGVSNAKEAIKEKFNDFKNSGGELVSFFTSSIEEKLANVKSSFAEKFGGVEDVFNSVKSKISDSVTGLSEKFEGFKSKSQEFAANLKESVSDLPSLISEKFSSIKDTIGSVMDNASVSIKDKWSEIKVSFEEGGGGLSGLVEVYFDQIAFAGQNLISNIRTIFGVDLSGIFAGFQSKWFDIRNKVVNVISGIQDSVNNLPSVIGEKVEEFKTKGTELMSQMKAGISEKISEVQESVANIVSICLSSIQSKYEDFKAKGQELMERVKTGIGNKLTEVKTKTTEVITSASTAIKNKYNEFKTKGQDLMTNLKNGVDSKISEIKTKTTEVMTNALSMISGKYEEFKKYGSETMTKVKDGIDSKISEIKTKTTELVNSALAVIADKYNSFRSYGSEAMNHLKSGIDSMGEIIASAARGIADWALSGINEKLSDFYTVGSNIVSGLKRGIESGWDMVRNAARWVAQGAKNAAMQELDENSPSKVFEGIGLFADEGLAIGFVNGISTVKDALHTVGQKTVKVATGIVSDVKDAMSSTFNVAPTIEPLVDISNVKDVDQSIFGAIGETISQIRDFADLNLDYEPTIRPVLDLSNISQNASRLNNLFPLDYSIGLAGQMAAEVGSNTNIQNSITVNNDDVVDAITELRSDFASMMNFLSRFQVVLDSGRLVGELIGPMDDALGRRSKYDGRGI